MKSKIVKFMSFMTVLALLLGLCACGNSKADNKENASDEGFSLGDDITFEGDIGTDDNTQSGTGNNSNTTVSSNVGSASGNNDIFKNIPKELKGKTVTVAHWGDEGGDKYQALAKAFTKLTNINVAWQLYKQESYEADISKQIAAGKGPDVVIMNDKIPQMYSITQPLPSIFNVNDGFWDPRITEYTKLNGKSYFVNSYNSPYNIGGLIVYNKRIFNDNGINSPLDYFNEGKWTYENLKQCMKDATALGYYGGIIEPIFIAGQMGVSLFSYDSAKGEVSGSVNNEKFLSAMRYYAECREEGLCGNYFIDAFPGGTIAIAMTDPYAIKYNGYLKDMSPSDFGAVPLPTSFGGQSLKCNPTTPRAYGIAKNAKNPEASYYFLRYFLDVSRYSENGIQIFGNKEMQKFYTETFLKNYKNQDLYVYPLNGILALTGSEWRKGSAWKEARNVAPGQVTVSFQKNANIVNNSVKEANARLKAAE